MFVRAIVQQAIVLFLDESCEAIDREPGDQWLQLMS